MASIAAAAASASTPAIKGTIYLDSLDAKIIQYQYGIQKSLQFIQYLKSVVKKCKEKDLIPFSKYIIISSGAIFNINDNIYRRSEILINGGKFNPDNSIKLNKVDIIPINFDLMDNSTNYETVNTKLPEKKPNLQSLILLELLLMNNLEIYTSKLEKALNDRDAIRVLSLKRDNTTKSTFEMEQINDLLIFNELKSVIYLNIENSISSPISQSPNSFTSPNNQNSHSVLQLRKIDYISLSIMIKSLDEKLNSIGNIIDSFNNFNKNKISFNELPNNKYLLHRMFIILLNLADISCLVKKFGRMIYWNNIHYLEKFLIHNIPLRNCLRNYKMAFIETRMGNNNQILTFLNKYLKQGNKFQVRKDTILEMTKNCNESYLIILNLVNNLKHIYGQWKIIIETEKVDNKNKQLLREDFKKRALEERNLVRRESMKLNSSLSKKIGAMYIDPSKLKLEKEKQSKLQKNLEEQAKGDRFLKQQELKEKELVKSETMYNKFDQREKLLRNQLSNNPNKLSPIITSYADSTDGSPNNSRISSPLSISNDFSSPSLSRSSSITRSRSSSINRSNTSPLNGTAGLTVAGTNGNSTVTAAQLSPQSSTDLSSPLSSIDENQKISAVAIDMESRSNDDSSMSSSGTLIDDATNAAGTANANNIYAGNMIDQFLTQTPSKDKLNALTRSNSTRSPNRKSPSATLTRRHSLVMHSPPSSLSSLTPQTSNANSTASTSPTNSRISIQSMQRQRLSGIASRGSQSPNRHSMIENSMSYNMNNLSNSSLDSYTNSSPSSSMNTTSASAAANSNSIKLNHIRAAAQSAHKNQKQQANLTAQQRLQQHILKSSQNGSMSTKVVPVRPKVSYNPSTANYPTNGSTSRTGSFNNNKDNYVYRSSNTGNASRTNSLQSISQGGKIASPLNSLVQNSNASLRKIQEKVNASKASTKNDTAPSEVSNKKGENESNPVFSQDSSNGRISVPDESVNDNGTSNTSNGLVQTSGPKSSPLPSGVSKEASLSISPSASTSASETTSASTSPIVTRNRSISNPIARPHLDKLQQTSAAQTFAAPPEIKVNNLFPLSSPQAVTRNRSNSWQTKENGRDGSLSPARTRSRSGSTRSYNREPIGNLLVVHEGDEVIGEEGLPISESGQVIKKVRFFNVSEYSTEEDAPSPLQSQKQMRQLWNRSKIPFNNFEIKKKEKLLGAQEGMAFRKFQNKEEYVPFSRNKSKELVSEENGKFNMMNVINSQSQAVSPRPKRFSTLFKRR
ncbi:hypothetical protein BVG19_g3966 [[Candida] boidinii]|nr:hypothetical protein BVG19_g3966 [[Candida] boidinii]OWB51352.1 hypothetical protein B5S27_g2912 [[Candida] boidinii]